MTAPARPAVALITRRIRPGTSIRRLRNQADYDLQRPFAAVDARKTIQAAERLFEIVTAQRDQQALASLATNIRTYERDVLRDITWRQT